MTDETKRAIELAESVVASGDGGGVGWIATVHELSRALLALAAERQADQKRWEYRITWFPESLHPSVYTFESEEEAEENVKSLKEWKSGGIIRERRKAGPWTRRGEKGWPE